MTALARVLVLALLLGSQPAWSQIAEAVPAERRAAARDAFRAFAEPFVGVWDCEIVEFDVSGKTVWSDRQRRDFRFAMHRHMLEERAILRTAEGQEYEGGLHLTSYDAGKDSIVQHGFWMPSQADPLFRLEGKIKGKGFVGEMRIRTETGEDRRPLVIRWIDQDNWVLEVTDEGPRGTYLRERLTYRRLKQS